MSREITDVLERAVEISRHLAAAADRGDSAAVGQLDAERLQLLKSVRGRGGVLEACDRLLWQEIALLNDQAIGHLEHHRRIKGRQMDVAVVGRRAVHAYASARPLR
jgi:hypothetical protein